MYKVILNVVFCIIFYISFSVGISLTIPRGAIRKGSVSLYLAVLRDDKDRPNLSGVYFY